MKTSDDLKVSDEQACRRVIDWLWCLFLLSFFLSAGLCCCWSQHFDLVNEVGPRPDHVTFDRIVADGTWGVLGFLLLCGCKSVWRALHVRPIAVVAGSLCVVAPIWFMVRELVTGFNGALDRGAPRVWTTFVEKKQTSESSNENGGTNTSYALILHDWKYPAATVKMSVRKFVYDANQTGAKMTVKTYPGFWGAEWLADDTP